jgi:sugar phosphate isomerase/epimerase
MLEDPAAQREISLSPLTVLPCTPLEQIEAAVEAGFRTVGLRLVPVMDSDIAVLEDPSLMRAISDRITATGLAVLDVEVTRIGPGTDVADLEPLLEFAGSLGARWLAVTSERRGEYRAEDENLIIKKLEALATAAERHGVGVMLEFMAFRGIATLGDAVRVVTAVARPNVRICLDVLHLFRSGGSVDALRALDPELIACAQLNDAPLTAPADLAREARFDRLLPGHGELPLRELVASLPQNMPLAIEVPSAAQSGVSPADRALAAYKSALALLH